MSRAYRIRVRESLRRVLRAEDHVRSQLEVLPILPAGEMAELLAEQLRSRGFELREDGRLVREQNGVTISIDALSGEVAARSEASASIALETSGEGTVYDAGDTARAAAHKQLQQRLRKDLEGQADRQRQRMQEDATNQLERELAGLARELDQAVNRATAEALKHKAAQLGRIKQLSDDPQTGSLTIVVEV
jgi:hypothetical protein